MVVKSFIFCDFGAFLSKLSKFIYFFICEIRVNVVDLSSE